MPFNILGVAAKPQPKTLTLSRKSVPLQVRLDMPPAPERQPPSLGQILQHKTPKTDPLLDALKAKSASRKAVQVAPPKGGKGNAVENPATAKPSANDAVAVLTARVAVLEAELARLHDELRNRPLGSVQKALMDSAFGCQRHR